MTDAIWKMRLALGAVVVVMVVADGAGWFRASSEPETGGAAVEWRLDNLDTIGARRVTRLGDPKVVDTPAGKAVEFDGASDALVLDVNPLAGLSRFTVEVLFHPASDGAPEQRFLHFQEAGGESRVMVETRLLPGGTWYLDTFLRGRGASLALIDREKTHATDAWHAVALTYDGREMAHYVNGVRELSGEVAFEALGPGRTSIGARLNRVHWFKGRMHSIRVTPRVLAADELLGVPAAVQGRLKAAPRRSRGRGAPPVGGRQGGSAG
jgi:hypothetical protein